MYIASKMGGYTKRFEETKYVFLIKGDELLVK